jgi:hypothetical protein
MIQSEITARIQQFTNELEALVRSAALEAVRQALGERPAAPARTARPATAPVRGPGRPRKAVSAKPAAPAAAAPAGKLPRITKKGGKRTPEQLAKIDSAIQGFVKSSPGKGVEAMAKSLGVPSKDLKLRIARLIDDKKLKKTGQKRATKYFVA